MINVGYEGSGHCRKIFIIRQLTLELRFNGHNYYLVQHGFVS